MQGRGEQGWGRSPSGDGPQTPVMCCAMLSTSPVNTQIGGEGITASPSAHRGKRREEIPTHVPESLNVTLSQSGGHPHGHPQLFASAQGLLEGCRDQALVTAPPGHSNTGPKFAGLHSTSTADTVLLGKGFKGTGGGEMLLLTCFPGRTRARREWGGQERWQPGRGSSSPVCSLEKKVPDLSPGPSSR